MIDRIVRVFWTTAVVVWLSAGLIAAPPLTITDAGYYLTYVDPNGVPSLVKIDTVVDLTDTDTDEPIPDDPKPDDPAPPKQDFDLAVVKAVKAAADKTADTNGALAIKAVYDHVAGAYADGVIDEASVWSILKVATDDALTMTSGSVNWSEFRSSVSAIITEAKQRGTLVGKPAVTKMLASVSQGVSMSADGKPSLSEAQLVQIAIKTNEAIDGQ